MPSWMQTLYWLQEHFWWIQAGLVLFTVLVVMGTKNGVDFLLGLLVGVPAAALCSFVLALTLAITLHDPSAIIVACIDAVLLVCVGRSLWQLWTLSQR